MRKTYILITAIFFSSSLFGQFGATGAQGIQGLGTALGLDTPMVNNKTIEQPNNSNQEPEYKEPKKAEDTFITQAKADIEKLKLQIEKLKIEQELAELKNKDKEVPLSHEEKELIRIKTENLQLLNLKEQIIIRDDLKSIEDKKKLREFPESSISGHETFRSDNFSLYETTSEVVATEGYVLGTGDVMQIELWGFKYWSKSYVITENGNINISGYTNIFVKGLTLRQARSLIASRLGVSGNTSSLAVTVTRPRMVSVTILGEVFNPGTYTLPATNSAFNFLVAMGGPTNIGSVRNIYIKRDGIVQDSFDLYEYFNRTLHTRDVYLQNGDYIIVSALSNVASINGAIRKPGQYEIKNSDNLSQAIAMAGGTLKNAYMRDVVITRFHNNNYEVISVNYDSLIRKGKDFNLNGVESISFKEIQSDFKVAVSVTGGVSVPGSYRLKNKMRISGIIKNANGLAQDAFLEKAYLVRTDLSTGKKEFFTFSPKTVMENPGGLEDLMVDHNDSIYIFRTREITQRNSIQITGSVYKPFQSNYISNLTLGQFVFAAGGYKPDADPNRGYILRTRDEYNKEIIPFNPSKVLTDSNTSKIEILPKDIVRIFSRSDMVKEYNIRISGAIVKKDTTLSFAENITIYDIIRLSGGLEEWAYTEKGIITRIDYSLNKKSTFIVNLDDIINDPTCKDNIILKRGDVVKVLDRRDMLDSSKVSIIGAVRKPGDFEFSENLRLSSLILKSGGLKTSAFKKRAFIISTDPETGLKNSKTIDLNEVFNDLNNPNNVLIKPGDSIKIYDLTKLNNNFTLSITGSVRKKGVYTYSDNMTLQNLIDQAGGLDFISAGSQLEIVRNFYSNNGEYQFQKPNLIILPISNDLSLDSNIANYELQPFDKIFVRSNPEFVQLRIVKVEGAVLYPGEFALQNDEKFNSIIKRAGGFNQLAYPNCSQLKRIINGDTISIILNYKKAINRRKSYYNYTLKDGDLIIIPYNDGIVLISGDINNNDGRNLGVYYKPHRRAKHYIKKYGGGFTKTSDRKRVIVEHKNGTRKSTKNYVIFKVYPKVRQGSTIIINSKTDEKLSFNTDAFINKIITRATAILTIIGIYRIAIGGN